MAEKTIPRIVVCGAVDDGKSTLIGRLLVTTGSAPLDEVASLTSQEGDVDYAQLTDGLIAEREQGITIDVAYRYLSLPSGLRVLLADSPGHEQYTRNMAVAASSADIAIVVVDLSVGLRDQTVRHAIVSHLMGVRSFIFALNKMDAIPDSDARARAIDATCDEILARLPQLTGTLHSASSGGDSSRVHFHLISARDGAGVETGYDSSPHERVSATSLVEQLSLEVAAIQSRDTGLFAQLAVQYVVKSNESRHYLGRLDGGPLSLDDEITVWPSGTRSRVTSIRNSGEESTRAESGDSIGITLAHDIDISRGDIVEVVHRAALAPADSRAHLADLVWIADEPLNPHASYLLRRGPTAVAVHVPGVRYRYDLSSGGHSRATTISANDIAHVEVTSHQPLRLSPYAESRAMGGFILCDRTTGETVAAGMTVKALRRESDVTKHDFDVTREDRETLFGVRAGVIWLTGLSGSGKSTIADALEVQLHKLGIHAFVLDGDSVRQGLSEDLGFAPNDRTENIRRIAHVAHMFMEAGIITIVSLVSPFTEDRDSARSLFADDDFIEVFVDTPLEVCESRDTKGLYAQARASASTDMTGIGQAYEAPEAPDIRLDGRAPAHENARMLRDWVLARRIVRG